MKVILRAQKGATKNEKIKRQQFVMSKCQALLSSLVFSAANIPGIYTMFFLVLPE